ncbi:MAG: hypothetical protein LQ345_007492, partial [Seirophora villosa]
MPVFTVSPSALQGLVALFVLTSVLLITSHRHTEPEHGSLGNTFVSRHSIMDHSRPFNGSKAHVKHNTMDHGHAVVAANETSHLVKRLEEIDFRRFKNHGDLIYAAIERSFVQNNLYGCDQPVPNFGPESIANGYSRVDRNELPTYGDWVDTFGRLLGQNKKPTVQQSFLVDLSRDQPFTNALGQQEFDNQARFKQTFIPSISAIVVQNIRSPAHEVKARFRRAGQPEPSGEEIATRHVPPLHRWSDVAWTLWRQKAGNEETANRLRYLAYDHVTNTDTRAVMGHLFETVARRLFVPYPGLEFGIDTDQGRALLGTPLGVGVGRILTDRAKQLGRRVPRVR